MRLSRPRSVALLLAASLLIPASGTAKESEEGAPAERAVIVGEEIERTGRVVALNPKSRLVVIEGAEGPQLFLKVPKTAPNFAKISVGDRVIAKYYEAVALAIAPVQDAQPGVTGVAAVASAPPGGTPGGAIAEQIQLRAVVSAVDPEARTVTLEVPGGDQRTLKAGEGVDLANVKVGEQVSVTHTQALAISLTQQ